MATARSGEFAALLVAELEGSFLGAGTPVAQRRAEVDAGLVQAYRFFSRADDVQRYMAIVLRRLGGWQAGPHPTAALEILANQALPARRRLEHFERWADRQQGGRRGR